MPSHRKQETNRTFEAKSDGGKTYIIVELANYTGFQALTGPLQWRKTTLEWRLASGEDVNQLDDGRYEILQTGEILNAE